MVKGDIACRSPPPSRLGWTGVWYSLPRRGKRSSVRRPYRVGPPVTHLFPSSTRQALHEQRARVAVLDAATAAEIALSTLLDQELHASPAAVSRLVRKQNRELGRLIEVLRALEVELLDNLKPDLAQIRNHAIHGAVEPTVEQARVAYGLAKELVERVTPTSTLLS